MIKAIIRFIMLSVIILALLCFSHDSINPEINTYRETIPNNIEKTSKELRRWLREEGNSIYNLNSTHIDTLVHD